MLTLNNLTPLVKKRKRIGRGGSRGGTATKGHKGQKARTGGTHGRVAFEGGQMPIFRRLPKRGFTNEQFAQVTDIVNLAQLHEFFEDGAHVDRATLTEKGLIKSKNSIKNPRKELKVLGKGTLSKKLTVVADAFSASAKSAIEKSGGKAQLIKEM